MFGIVILASGGGGGASRHRRHQHVDHPHLPKPAKTPINESPNYLGRPSQVKWGHCRAEAQVLVPRQSRVEKLREGEREERVDLVAGRGQVLGGK